MCKERCSDFSNRCHICKNVGHQPTFCPKSIKSLEPSFEVSLSLRHFRDFADFFQYVAICHNCDQWHLPFPCHHDFVQCPRCGNHGHQAHFCPRYPLSRGQDPVNGIFAVTVAQVHHELLRRIKAETCSDTIRLLENHSKEEVLEHMSHTILPPLQSVLPPGPPSRRPSVAGEFQQAISHAHARSASTMDSPPTIVAHDDPFAPKNPQYIARPYDPNTSPNMPPTPHSTGGKLVAFKAGTVQDIRQGMQRNPEHVQMAQIEQSSDGTADRLEGQAPKKKPKISKPKADKPRVDKSKLDKSEADKPKAPRRPAKPRCAACKKRHKRCDHNGPQGNDDSGASQSPQPGQTPDGYVAAAENSEEQQTARPDAIDPNQSSIVHLQVAQSGHDTPTPQPEFGATESVVNEPITQEQEHALRSALAGMPPAFSQLQSQNMSMHQGNNNQKDWLARSAQQAMSFEHLMTPATSADESQSSHNAAHFNPGYEPQVMAFQPPTQVLESNGHAFAHTNQGWQTRQPQTGGQSINPLLPKQMPVQGYEVLLDENQRVVAPNHHNNDVFEFDDNGQVVESVEQKNGQAAPTDGEDGMTGTDQPAEGIAAKKASGGRKRSKYLQSQMHPDWKLTNFPEADE